MSISLQTGAQIQEVHGEDLYSGPWSRKKAQSTAESVKNTAKSQR